MITVDTWLKTYNTKIVESPRSIFFLSRGQGIYHGEDPTEMELVCPATIPGYGDLWRIKGTSSDSVVGLTGTATTATGVTVGSVTSQVGVAVPPTTTRPWNMFHVGATGGTYYFSNRTNVADANMAETVCQGITLSTNTVTDIKAPTTTTAQQYGAPTAIVHTLDGETVLAQNPASGAGAIRWKGTDPNLEFNDANLATVFPLTSTWVPSANKFVGWVVQRPNGALYTAPGYFVSSDGYTFQPINDSTLINAGPIHQMNDGSVVMTSRVSSYFGYSVLDPVSLIKTNEIRTTFFYTLADAWSLSTHNKFTDEIITLSSEFAIIYEGGSYRTINYNDGIKIITYNNFNPLILLTSFIISKDGTYIINDGSGNIYSGPSLDNLTVSNYGTDIVDLHVIE